MDTIHFIVGDGYITLGLNCIVMGSYFTPSVKEISGLVFVDHGS